MTNNANRVVALGGGHGLAAILRALTSIQSETTAVVTVADDGGSSGRLRQEYGILPPGDLRMALSALCPSGPQGSHNAELFQYRFSGEGNLAGHPIGNLILTALWDIETDKVAAIARAGALLGAQGRVLPMSTKPLTIEANVEDQTGAVHRISGQATVATTTGRILDVSITPENPAACPEAIQALTEADWIILGPGSWYTSVMPALIIPELRDAIIASPARKLIVLNLVEQLGETEGLGPDQHLGVLRQHAPGMSVDVVLVDSSHERQAPQLQREAADLGARVIFADVRDTDSPSTHDPERLSRVLGDILARVP